MNDKLLGVILYIIFAIVIIAFIIYKVKTETPEKKKARQKELEAFKERKEQKKQAQTVSNIITCPNCNSKNVSFLQQDKKAFSVGKAAAGAVLTGGIGTLAGFTGKKGNKQWHCQNCGNMFETK